jgi:hypothetical protein
MRALTRAFRACLWSALSFLASSGLGCAQHPPSKPELDPRRLFAPALQWTAVAELPRVTDAELQALSADLRVAYMESAAPHALQDSGVGSEHSCSFAARALASDADARGSLRWLGNSTKANHRILYTGTSHCSEASVTALWAREGDRWQLVSWAFGDALFLRLEPDPADVFLMRLAACCADRVDVYKIQSLNDSEPLAQVGIDIQTLAPASVIGPEPVTSRSEGLLRRSPERDDAPNETLTLWAEAPVFGNQLDRFKAGASGWVSARVEDPSSGEDWCFVSLPRVADASPTAGVFSVQAGWSECAHLRADED